MIFIASVLEEEANCFIAIGNPLSDLEYKKHLDLE